MKKAMLILTLFCFFFNSVIGVKSVQAQDFVLPKPGAMVRLSPEFNPSILKGVKIHRDNPFQFDFILDKGDAQLSNDQLTEESSRLIKYFLASLTIPEKDLWVNLSPYEKDRIIPQAFGQTEMGRDLLAEDYMLKQITASLIYPEDEVGKKFWKNIYEKTAKQFGTSNVPVNTFNKVWIVPQKAVVYENTKEGVAYVVESSLKVMLEEDYLALSKNTKASQASQGNKLASQVVRDVIIPELTKEVNQGANFAKLRQVYNSMILATWYKKKIKNSILSEVYSDQSKIAGVGISDPQEKEKIYQQYLQAFKQGAYNYIKEEVDPITKTLTPRKYFSGGMVMQFRADEAMTIISKASPLMNTIAALAGSLLMVGCQITPQEDQLNTPAALSIDSTKYPENSFGYQNPVLQALIEQVKAGHGIEKNVKSIKWKTVITPRGPNMVPVVQEESIGSRIIGKREIPTPRSPTVILDKVPVYRVNYYAPKQLVNLQEVLGEDIDWTLIDFVMEGIKNDYSQGELSELVRAFIEFKADSNGILRLDAFTFELIKRYLESQGKIIPETWKYRYSFVAGVPGFEKVGVLYAITLPKKAVVTQAGPGLESTSQPEIVEAAVPVADESAMLKGGIDLNSDQMEFKIKNDGGEIKVYADPALINQLKNASGFVPMNIRIMPLMDIKLFLGLNNDKNDQNQLV